MILKGLNRKEEPIQVEIQGNIITKVTPLPIEEKNKLSNYIIPGFIDIHTHGGYNTDFTDASEEATRKYLRNLSKEGTTSILHASITTPKDNLMKSIKVARYVMDHPKNDEVRYLGINIEGNYLNKAKKGAHKESLLEPLNIKDIDMLSSENNIKLFSYAAENCDPSVTKHLVEKGITPSLAHSIATDEEVMTHFKAGLRGVTHTFNAMATFHHRNPTAIVTALTEDEIYTEIIVDGIHVHPRVVNLLYRSKPANKILIISDSAPAKGCPDGIYQFGELQIKKIGNKIVLADGSSLAGSIANMHLCFTNFLKFTNATLEEASMMTSTNQATYLKLDKLGEIKEGFFADILVLDKNYNILKTIANGNVLYEKNN